MEKTASPIAWNELLAQAVSKPGLILEAYTNFYGYSLGNQMLALGQCLARGLAPGPIATFKRWQELGRTVQKGQKALLLCMPISIKKKDSEDKMVWFTFKPRWFVLSQTEGADYKANMPAMDWDGALAERKLNISEVTFSSMNGNCMGSAKDRTYTINPLNQLPHKTRFHEMAHIVLGHTESEACVDGEELTKSIKEVEAESVALILCETLSLPGCEYARGYIQHFLGAMGASAIPEKNAQRIFACAEKILKAGFPKVEKEETVEA